MNKTQQDSKNGIDILAEMTRRDFERSLHIKETDNVTVCHSPRHGLRLVKPLHILNEKSEQNSTTNN